MKIARTKNTVRNIAFGTFLRIVNIVLPFVSRTVILYVLGAQYLGLSSLFGSVLSFLSLAELGVGGAMIYSMYKPIAENDTDTIRALLNLYKKIYRIIGTVILVLGLCLLPFLTKIIHGDIPEDTNIYVLYLIYLINAVLSYWLFAYKNALMQAYQRTDLDSKIALFITPVSYIVMLGCLFLTRNYYFYIIWLPIFTILTNILRCVVVNKQFPGLEPKGDVSKELKKSITKKVTALIGTKLNTVVLNAADNIVMSAFLGLTVIAIYGNYYYIMSSIIGFLGICYSAMTAGLGNSLQTETLDKNYKDFEKFSFINSWLVGWCTVCLVCLYQPFMRIWVQDEELMFPFVLVLEFALYFYVYQIRKIPITYKDAGGIWWEDRFRPYVCMIVNIVLNIWLVQVIGVSGIILSTVFSLFISIPWENYTIFKFIFHCSSKKYYFKMTIFFITMAVGGFITYWLCSLFSNGIPQLFARMGICLVVPNVVFILLNFKREEFKGTINLAKSILKREM
jgi:O-antigen/teichoic acid export membrane protein